MREVVSGSATRANLVRARRLLDLSRTEGAVADGLRAAIGGARLAHEQQSLVGRTASSAWRTYDRLLEWPWFHRLILLVFVGQAVVALLWAAALGWLSLSGQSVPVSTVSTVELVTSLVSLALSIVGVARLRASRLDAYRWFERSVLISIFFTQVVMFWEDQLSALSGLIVDLVLLAGLRFLTHQETARHEM